MADKDKGQYFREGSTGAKVYSRGNQTFLRPKNWEPGQPLLAVDNDKVADTLAGGEYLPASAEDVRARDLEKEHGGALGQLKTGAKAAAAGAVDAVTVIPRGIAAGAAIATGAEDRDPLGPALGGRQVQENAVGVLSELLGLGNAEAAGREYSETAREEAETNPLSAAAGYAGGQLAATALTGGSSLASRAGAALTGGSKLAAPAVAGILEGGVLGAAGAGEQAFIADTDLTAEQMLAGMGWGALIGGGVGLGAGGAKALFGRMGSRGTTPLDSPRAAPPDAALEAVSQRALGGVPPVPGLMRHLRDGLEAAQAAAAGVDRQALREVGATRGFLDPASEGFKKRGLWWNRDKIWQGSTQKLTRELETAAENFDDVAENVINGELKKGHMAGKLTGDSTNMVRSGWDELSRVKSDLGSMLGRADEFGNTPLLNRRVQLLEALEPKSATAEDVFIALDRTKRALQQDVKALRTSATRSGDALQQMQSRQLADALEATQERVRTMLEDSSVWGEAGNAQKAINARWGEYIRTQSQVRDAFFKRVETDYHTGRPIYRVDPDKVAAYIRKTGRQEGALVDEYFRRNIDAREALAKEIGAAFETGGDELGRLSASSKAIKSTLGELDETARAVNQIQAIMEAEGSSGAAGLGAVLGGVLGGAPGAVVGGALGAITKPGTMIRQAAAIEQLARNVNLKIEKGLSDFFERAAAPIRALAPQAAKVASKTRPLPTVTALELFRGKEANNQKAYKKRVQEVLAASGNFGAGIREATSEALGDLPGQAPKLSQAMVTTATRGAEFLKSKIPAPLVDTKSLTPHAEPVIVSDQEIAEFARYWSAVSNPLSVLDDLRRGVVTEEQVEAVRVVYPKLYQAMQNGVRAKLMQLDEKGIIVPYQARLQLDLLLGLDGAGEETASVDFMLRYQQAAATVPNNGVPQAKPPMRPVQLTGQVAPGSTRLDTTQQESSAT